MAHMAKADSNPTKAFFVRMITKDIALDDCILDLIDNSVDGALVLAGGEPMSLDSDQDLSAFRISIVASEDSFQILDNCGGITLNDAVEYAFTFGRKDDDQTENYSIGVYGIGMKRAIFKLGNETLIQSTYREADGMESFEVPINVTGWLAREDKDWDFDIDTSEPLPEPGVKISVSDLHEDTSSAFASPAFISRLKRTISRDYALFLSRGLVVEVNDDRIAGWQIELRQGEDFRPYRNEYFERGVDDDINHALRVEFLAGMAAPPPDAVEPDPRDKKEDRFGWYVVCNGRIVVAADKSQLTGWGTEDWPQWHYQYNGFMGIVLFTAKDARYLPLTTTKRSVDASSGVYRRARGTMREISKAWIAYTYERKQALEEAKRIEAQAAAVALKDVAKGQDVLLPKLVPVQSEPTTTIAYLMEKRRVQKLAAALGSIGLSNREVGKRSFEYTFQDFVDED